MVTHPGIGKISFTGSTRAGGAIMEAIGRTGVKPVTLELGGKSPQVVFADADLELAAGCVARGILANAGQVCVAGSRLIVARAVAEELAERIEIRTLVAARARLVRITTELSNQIRGLMKTFALVVLAQERRHVRTARSTAFWPARKSLRASFYRSSRPGAASVPAPPSSGGSSLPARDRASPVSR